jgi:protein-tyrosine-phosphatase
MRRLFTGREVHDVLVHDDPGSGLVELFEAARAVGRKLGNAVPDAAGWRRHRARAKLASLQTIAREWHIIFVCHGNICRSPFAEALLRAQLGDALIAVGSAGMMPQPGRSTPALGLEAAAARGIDLSAHRSTRLTRQMCETASSLIVFDEITRTTLLDRYPDVEVPIILLGDLAGLSQIADPVDGDAAEFGRIYAQIGTAIGELTQLLRGAARRRKPPGP